VERGSIPEGKRGEVFCQKELEHGLRVDLRERPKLDDTGDHGNGDLTCSGGPKKSEVVMFKGQVVQVVRKGLPSEVLMITRLFFTEDRLGTRGPYAQKLVTGNTKSPLTKSQVLTPNYKTNRAIALIKEGVETRTTARGGGSLQGLAISRH